MRVVVAAVISDGAGRYLVARRPAGRHLAGLWEFPGGQVEAGEAPGEALARELEEELGVSVGVGAPLTFAFHRDDARDVLLLFYRATLARGTAHGREGQEVRWVSPAELAVLDTPPADAELIRSLASAARPARQAGARRTGGRSARRARRFSRRAGALRRAA